jgi:hypothetical protein
MTDVLATQRVRDLSRILFGGAQYRLEIGAAIAEGDGVVCITDLAGDLAEPDDPGPGTGSVNTEFKVLERAHLLVRGPRERSDRRVYLLRQESLYWEMCRELRDSARGRAPAES